MKVTAVVLMSLLPTLCAYAQELTAEEKARLESMDAGFAQDPKNISLDYAWLLYRSGLETNYRKSDTVLNQIYAAQDSDPDSITYGQWDWHWENGEKKVDFNRALFKADILFVKLWDLQDRMGPEARANFITICKQVTEAAKRRWDTEVFDIGRDFTSYSNIFVVFVETLTLAGDRFNDARLKKTAKSQWTRWFNHISFWGIDEFASPNYNRVIFSHLMNIHNFCHDERIERETQQVLDHIYLLQSAITHPLLQLPVSGISRDYRIFLLQGDPRSEFFASPIEGYSPPPKALEINSARKYPFEVMGKASLMPFIFKSYQLPDAAMGSMTGGNCFQQQIHCIAAAGKNANERAVVFLQGSNTPVNGYTDQKETTSLCVYNRLPTYWHFTQWRGDLANYKETFGDFGIGISSNWKEKLNSPDHIVLEAYGYDVHIFPFAVKNECIAPCELTLTHRTTTSPRYHPRPRTFDEYVFPQEPDWFGAYIALVKSGAAIDNPRLTYANQEGILSFNSDLGHQIRLFVTENGDTKQLFNVDPALIPLFKISQ